MRAWPVARSIFDAPLVREAPYVREANERTTGWITLRTARAKSSGQKSKKSQFNCECAPPVTKKKLASNRAAGEVGYESRFDMYAFLCQMLPGLPRAARPSWRFAFGKTPRGRNVRQAYPTCCPLVRFSHIREHRRCCARRAMRAW